MVARSGLLTRRALLHVGAATGGIALSSLLASCGLLDGGGANDSAQGSAGLVLESEAPLPQPFHTRLPIPPLLEPVRRDSEADHYEIVQKVGRASILPGLTTEVWGYNGIVPGPTIVSQSGRRTVVVHRNELPVPVVVHLHGGKTAPEHDGYPTDLILPRGGTAVEGHSAHHPSVGSREYVYEMDQPAATLWYHDHRVDFTGPQVYRGLAGFHLIHDDAETALGLPDGDRDIPLMIMDRAFAADGSLLHPSADPTLMRTPGVTSEFMSGVLGDCILVNGAPWPVLEVSDTRYRLRALDIAQAERFDVVVDFSGHDVGDDITMTNEFGSGGTAEVMRFRVARHEEDTSVVPDQLATIGRLRPGDAVVEREFVFARGGAQAHGLSLWTVNGEPFSPDTIVATPELGTTEKWTIRAQNVEHPFHIHLAPFQVVGHDGEDDPGRFNSGWKDTVNLANGGRADLLIRFDGYRGKYVFHCHNLEHEDMMMMANFEVI